MFLMMLLIPLSLLLLTHLAANAAPAPAPVPTSTPVDAPGVDVVGDLVSGDTGAENFDDDMSTKGTTDYTLNE